MGTIDRYARADLMRLYHEHEHSECEAVPFAIVYVPAEACAATRERLGKLLDAAPKPVSLTSEILTEFNAGSVETSAT